MPKLIKEDIDRWMQHGIYLQTRTIYLGGLLHDDSSSESWVDGDMGQPGINFNTARRVIMGIHLLECNAQDGRKPITILMNSCGGDWSHGMAVHNAIKYSKNWINIINLSHARSMTSLIFQAGDYRITAPDGYYMIHDGEDAEAGSPRTVNNWAKFSVEKVLPRMYGIYLERLKEMDEETDEFKVDIRMAADIINSKLSKGTEKVKPSKGIKGINIGHIQQLCAQDTIFSPEEMIKLNFADRMLETNDLVGGYINEKMSGLPTGMDSLEIEDE